MLLHMQAYRSIWHIHVHITLMYARGLGRKAERAAGKLRPQRRRNVCAAQLRLQLRAALPTTSFPTCWVSYLLM